MTNIPSGLPARSRTKIRVRRREQLIATGKQDFSAYLGNANGRAAATGRVDVPGSNYLYWAQKIIGVDDNGNAMFGPPLSCMSGAQIPELHGTPVIVRPLSRTEYKIIEIDSQEIVRQGRNPRGYNLLSPYNKFIKLANALPFMIYSIGTSTTPSMLVVAKPYRYRNADGNYIQQAKQQLDLTSFLPAADGDGDPQQVVACIFADFQGVLSVVTSTPKLTTDVLTWDDVEECMDGAPIRAVAGRAYKLRTSQTNITSSDHFGDIREWFPVQQRKSNFAATVAPDPAVDDITLNYEVGSWWFDITNDRAFVCLDNSEGVAIWRIMSYGGHVRTTAATYNMVSDDVSIFANTDNNAITVNLLPGAQVLLPVIIKNSGSNNTNVTIVPDGSEHLIGLNNNFVLLDGENLIIEYDSTDGWY